MKFAIADPPYPPSRAAGGSKRRGSRWYGNPVASSDRMADTHPEVGEWDSPERHRQLVEHLIDNYDGWAIATAPDGICAYEPLPASTRIMVWVKPNSQPGSHRLRSCWEPVLLCTAADRRSNRGRGQISDVLTHPAPRLGFPGAKPLEWTSWVLSALCYDPAVDTVDDLFPGSGSVSRAIELATYI